MSISLAYGLTRKLLGALVTVVRRDVSNDAELLVLRHENAVLRRQVERVRYEPQDRLWLAALSSLIPRRRWAEVFAVTPVTLLAWHRRLAAGKYTAAPTRPGRPELTQRSGRWWCGWRSTTPAGVSQGARGVDTAGTQDRPRYRVGHPERRWNRSIPATIGSGWRQFLTVQAHGILAVDFVHIDTVLLKRIYALVLIEHGTRRVHLLGITINPDGAWSTQAARNMLMDLGERAKGFKFMIRDRGGQFTDAFDAVLADAGIRVIKSPPQAPRANAICERMIGTLRRELLDRTLILGERHLCRVLDEFLAHYSETRPHRALGQLNPHQAETTPPEPINLADYRLRRKTVLGGLTSEYQLAS